MRKQAQIIIVLFTQVGAGTSLKKAGIHHRVCSTVSKTQQLLDVQGMNSQCAS